MKTMKHGKKEGNKPETVAQITIERMEEYVRGQEENKLEWMELLTNTFGKDNVIDKDPLFTSLEKQRMQKIHQEN